jgi:hypothetical protein
MAIDSWWLALYCVMIASVVAIVAFAFWPDGGSDVDA